MLWRMVGFVVVFFMLMGFLCSPTGAVDSEKEKNNIRLFLYESIGEDEMIELDLSISSDAGICAVLCYLEYDPDSLIYLSGGASDKEINFKAVDFGGAIRFLIDCATNSSPDGDLARLYFKRIGTGSSNFSLTCSDALYLDENGEIVRADVEILTDPTSEKVENKDPPKNEVPPVIVGTEIRDGSVLFSVNVGEGFFAAGVRLFFVDLSGDGENFDALVAGVVKEDGRFNGEFRFCPSKSYAVVITAQGYSGKRTVKGDKIVLIYTRQD